MEIKAITIGGYKNIKNIRLNLSTIIALVSLNNYGKSNVLQGIKFGMDFIGQSNKNRLKSMLEPSIIPLNPETANCNFTFEIEFDEPALEQYRYVKYGFSFAWFRNDGKIGAEISDEWIGLREHEKIRYTSYLKRQEGKYRPTKASQSFRKIVLAPQQLAIDVLTSFNKIEIAPVIQAIQKLNFNICESIEVTGRYRPSFIEPDNRPDINELIFNDPGMPRALFNLKKHAPDKYELFENAVYTLFPEFSNIELQTYKLENFYIDKFVSSSKTFSNEGKVIEEKEIPFRINTDLYRLLITSDYYNQPLDISQMSAGTKRIFWLLANACIASCANITLLGIEELETSVHPKMVQDLLELLMEMLENTTLIITSHSPYIIQYLQLANAYVGLPNKDGLADFKNISTNKIPSLVRSSHKLNMSTGEYLFHLMSGESDAHEILTGYLDI